MRKKYLDISCFSTKPCGYMHCPTKLVVTKAQFKIIKLNVTWPGNMTLKCKIKNIEINNLIKCKENLFTMLQIW